MSAAARPIIYLVSDGTCRTCEQVVRAVLVQFKDIPVDMVKKRHVRRPEDVAAVVDEAAQAGALVFYTLVYDKARAQMQDSARQRMVPVVDVLGPVLVSIYDLLQSGRRAKPGILYKTDQEHLDRIDAVEYTLHHDDGCRVHELGDADVVLVGVSRCSKSTTCFYLAYSGIRAANVPLFANSDPPAELLNIDPRRVVGLTVNPYRLKSIREARLRSWAMDVDHHYADKVFIAEEVRTANELMERHGWRCIDASYKAVEEIAREVLSALEQSGVVLEPRRVAGS